MGVIWWVLGAVALVALVAAIMFFGLVIGLAWATRGGVPHDDDAFGMAAPLPAPETTDSTSAVTSATRRSEAQHHAS